MQAVKVARPPRGGDVAGVALYPRALDGLQLQHALGRAAVAERQSDTSHWCSDLMGGGEFGALASLRMLGTCLVYVIQVLAARRVHGMMARFTIVSVLCTLSPPSTILLCN